MLKMKEMVKENARKAACTTLVLVPSALPSLTAYAAEGDAGAGDVTGALITACTSIAASITSAINGVIPIALPLVGAGLVVVIGLKVFKRITNKA